MSDLTSLYQRLVRDILIHIHYWFLYFNTKQPRFEVGP